MEQQNPIAKWPFGAATLVVLMAAGIQVVSVVNNLTIVDGTSNVATADRTINLDIATDVEPGARLIVKSKTNATENLIPGTCIKGTVVPGTSGKTKVVEYVYDGTSFIQTAAAVQID